MEDKIIGTFVKGQIEEAVYVLDILGALLILWSRMISLTPAGYGWRSPRCGGITYGRPCLLVYALMDKTTPVRIWMPVTSL